MNGKEPLWTKNFMLICLTNLLLFGSFYFLLPTLPVFIAEVLKGDESKIGLIIGALSLTAVLVRPLAGFLLDAVGRKQVLFFALISFALAMGAYNFVNSLVLLFLLRVLHGIAWGFASTGAGTIAADVVPPARRGEGLGYYGLSNTLAMAVGPSLGFYILNHAGFSSLFIGSFLIAVLAWVSMLGISYQVPTAGRERRGINLESFVEPKVFSVSGIMFFIAVVYGGIISFITLLGKEIGIANSGSYFLIYALVLLFIRPYAGNAFDKKGPLKIMPLGFAAIALSFVLLFLARGTLLFALSAIAMGIGFGIVQPTAMAMAINSVAPLRRGAANGTILSAFDLGIAVGSFLLGVLAKKVGLFYMYLSCSFIVIIPFLLFYLTEANKYRLKINNLN